ncbi:5361_t:CDS:2 [Racocetra fulgida]|uniref:5361_t:CDS:1 n=1 Tax=Racocetra fulgida TaxID=60492 RepID=A0A9N8YZ68_9GLOM|nr:5361_t:CDS:2 [Racocetra fulgida]
MEAIIKKDAKTKDLEKLFGYAKELEKIRSNLKILFKNQDELDKNEKEVEKYISVTTKEIKRLTFYQQISKNVTKVGGALTLAGSVISGGLKSSGYSYQGDLLLLVSSGVGGFLTLTSSITEKKFNDIYDHLFWLSRTARYSEEIDKAISKFLARNRKFKEEDLVQIEKKKIKIDNLIPKSTSVPIKSILSIPDPIKFTNMSFAEQLKFTQMSHVEPINVIKKNEELTELQEIRVNKGAFEEFKRFWEEEIQEIFNEEKIIEMGDDVKRSSNYDLQIIVNQGE